MGYQPFSNCGAHLLNLAVQDVLELPELAPTLMVAKSIVKFFRVCELFSLICAFMYLYIFRLTMLRRLLKAHQAVAAALSELSDHQACPLDLTLAQWATIKQLCDVLAPLKVY